MGRRTWTSVLSASLLFALGSCRHNPVGPVIEPGARNYIWTVDTLKTEFNDITGFWGASPTNIWAGGDGGTEADFLWHYDGTKWIPWYATYGGSKGLAYCSASAIFGFDSNGVWIGGQSFGDPGAGLCHWNGSRWGQYFNYNPEPDTFSFAMVTGIWGFRPDDIYACGVLGYSLTLVPQGTSSKGFLLHYDGSVWKEIAIADSGRQCGFIKMRGEDGQLYIQEYRGDGPGDSVVIAFYELDSGRLTRIYSNILGRMPSTVNFEFVGNELYFPFSNDVYTYSNGEFIKQMSINLPNWNYFLCGRSREDIFLSMADGLAHFNGTDYEYLYKWQLGQMILGGCALFDKEVFFPLYERATGTNMILHGRLTEEGESAPSKTIN
ncbi:MAG: hypothetical protein M1469_02800 [Bacteroidetes bacterium]|nr:hypothetical protein [Bacteroidota bacterium]